MPDQLFTDNPSTDVSIDADNITAIANAGTAVVLQANNDLTVNEAIIVNNAGGDGGSLTLQAGRSVTLNAAVTTDNGNLSITANDSNAVLTERDAGAGGISVLAAVDAGTGTVNLSVDSTGAEVGVIAIDNSVTAAAVNLTAAAGVTQASGGAVNAASLVLAGTGDFGLTGDNDTDTISGTIDGVLNYVDTDDVAVGGAGLSTSGNATLAANGDITVNADITNTGATGTTTLRLEATNNVVLDNDADITAAAGTMLNVDLVADTGAGDATLQTGVVKILNGSSIVTSGGNIRIGGGTGTFGSLGSPGDASYEADLEASAARGTATDVAGVLLDSATLDAGAGNIDIRGAGFRTGGAGGVVLSNASTVTGDSVTVHGAGGESLTGDGNAGVIVNAGTSITGGDSGLTVRGLGRGDADGVGVLIIGAVGTTGTGTANVTGLSAATGDASHGVYLNQGSVTSAGTGDITIVGTGAGTTQSDGVRMVSGAQAVASSSGDVTVTGSGSGASGVGLAMEGFLGSTIGGASSTGAVTINADTVSLPFADITGLGTLTLRPITSGTSVGLGTGALGTLFLNDAALASLSLFSDVTFGGNTAGTINTAALDFSANATNYTLHGAGLSTLGLAIGNSQALTFIINGGVTQTGAITAGSLLLSGTGAMTLIHAGNDVDILAGDTPGAVRFWDSDGFQIGSVNLTDGYTAGAALELMALTGAIDVAQAVAISSAGASLLADEIEIGAAISGPGSLYLAPVSGSTDVRVGDSAPGGAGLDLTGAELANITGVTFLGIGLEGGTGTLTVPNAYTFDRYTSLRMGGAGGIVDVLADVRSEGGGLGLFGATNRIGGDLIATGGDLIINGAVRLTDNVLVDATDGGATSAGGNIEFRSTIDADAQANDRTLTITNGASGVTLGGVGANDALAGLTVNAQAVTLADVRTTGSQAYNGPVTLSGTLASITSGDITFQSSVALSGDSAIATGGNAGDDVTFRGAVTGTSDLTLTTGDGDTILFGDVSGDVLLFNDRVVLERDVSVNGVTSVRFAGPVDSFTGEANDLTVNSPDTTFGGMVGAGTGGVLGALRTDSTGTTTIDTSQVVVQNGINFLDTVVLGATTVITSTTAGVEFGKDVQSDGSPRGLTVNAPTGVIFRQGVGTTSSLAGLTVAGAATLGDDVTTNGAQNYQALTLAGDVSINAGSLTIAGTLNSDSAATPRDLIVATGNGASVFGGEIGGVHALDTLEVTADNIALGRATTSGGQRYAGETTLSGNVRSTTTGPITFAGDLLITTGLTIASAGAAPSDDVNFQGSVDSQTAPHNLTVTAGLGDVLFSDAVGTTTSHFAIDTLNVSGAAVGLRNVRTVRSQVYTGATSLNGSLSTTGQGAIAIGGALTLQTDASITTTQGDIVFGGTVNSDNTARALTVNSGSGGTTRFVSAVGNTLRLASLTTNSDGVTRLEGGQVRTTGDQTYNDNVRLGTNVTMEANDVTFAGLLNSDSISTPRNLTVNSAVNSATSSDTGETVFAGVVGGQARLGLLTTNNEGTTRLGDSVFTSRGVNMQDAVTLAGNNITIDGSGGPLTFRSTINTDASVTDANLVLISSAAGDADNPAFRFGGHIGGVKRLGSLAIGADRTTATSGSVVLSDAFDSQGRIVKANVSAGDSFTVTTGPGGFAVGGGHKVVALGSLTITTSGTARFGDVAALNNFTVNAGDIRLRRRPGSAVQVPNSGNFNASQTDSGGDIVTGGNVNFNVVPTFEGTGGVFAYSTGTRLQDAQLSGIVYREPLTGLDANRFNDPRTATFLLGLDLIASGPSSTQIAPAVITNPRPLSQPPENLARAGLPADLLQALAEIGVDVNARGMDQIVDGLSGRNFDTDLPASVGPQGLTWRVSADRIDENAARAVVDDYRALMFTTQTDADGTTTTVSRADVVREVLGASWDHYAAEVRLTSGAGWRAYLDTMGSTGGASDAQAREFLIRLQRIVMGLEDMGLAPDEARPAITRILGMVRPAQVTAADFEQAVRGKVTLSAR